MSHSIAYMSLHWTNWHGLIINKYKYIYIYVLTTKSLIIITLPVQFPIFQGYYAIYHVHQKRDTPGIKRKLEQKHLNPPTIHHHPSPSITIHHHPSPSITIHHHPPEKPQAGAFSAAVAGSGFSPKRMCAKDMALANLILWHLRGRAKWSNGSI